MKKYIAAIFLLISILFLTGCEGFHSEVSVQEFKVVRTEYVAATTASGVGINPSSGGLTVGGIDMTTGSYAPLSVPIDSDTPEQYNVILTSNNRTYTVNNKALYELAKKGQPTFLLTLEQTFFRKTLVAEDVHM